MKTPHIVGLLLAAATLVPMVAQAADGTINIGGTVAAATCAVAAPATFTVNLPTMSTAQLNAAGVTAGNTNFSVSVTGCTGSPTSATMYFEAGSTVDTVSGRLNNTGTATNVQIQLLNATGAVVDLSKAAGAQNSTAATIVSSAAKMNYTARYYATAAAGVGTVISTVTYSVIYN